MQYQINWATKTTHDYTCLYYVDCDLHIINETLLQVVTLHKFVPMFPIACVHVPNHA